MRTFRIVIEEEDTGREVVGYAPLSHGRVQAIRDAIHQLGDHEIVEGDMPGPDDPVPMELVAGPAKGRAP